MAFCLPTTYFTSALFSSLVVGFCSGHSLGLGFERCFFHYQWATFRNLSELWKNFNEPARWAVDKNPPCLLGDNPLLFFRLLQYKLISCVIELFVRRNSPRSTLVWKAVWACLLLWPKPGMFPPGGPDTFISSLFGWSPVATSDHRLCRRSLSVVHICPLIELLSCFAQAGSQLSHGNNLNFFPVMWTVTTHWSWRWRIPFPPTS